MKLKIFRGTNEIGGTCLQLTASNGKILWVDCGAPLDPRNPDVSYSKGKVDALLISHPHQDHYGLMENIDPTVPIYIGEVAFDFINATKLFIDKPLLSGNYIDVKPWKSFTVLDTFVVKAYLTDHSTPESFAFQIDVDGKRLYYSGDFRATGRKKKLFNNIIKSPPKNIDILFIEGTMIERENHKYESEDAIEYGLVELLKKQKNVSFLISSAQNIDRLISLIRACKKTGKTVVVDVYTAWLLDMLHKQSTNVPTMDWKEIKVYCHPTQIKKIENKNHQEFHQRVISNSLGNYVFSNPSQFVYFVRNPNKGLINKLRKNGIINVIYSQWEGYLQDEFEQYFTKNLNTLKEDDGISFSSMHTSGHAPLRNLVQFTKAINAKKVVPIHTAYPKKFKDKFEEVGINNIHLLNDGIEYEL